MSKENTLRLFGTDGVRGVAGEFPLDPATVRLIGNSLAQRLTAKLGRRPRIVIGRDTRESGPLIEESLVCGLSARGAEVELADVLTTPGVAFITRELQFDAGIVISASHNPYQDNGIKVFSPTGKKLTDEIEKAIAEDVDRALHGLSISESRELKNEIRGTATSRRHEFHDLYLDFLATEIGKGLSLGGLRMAVDCANGAAFETAPELFRRLGAAVDVLSANPDGRNINRGCGSLHLEALQHTVRKAGLSLGVAFDGDADRALFVDSTGALVDGDTTLLILAQYLQSKGELKNNLVVATVMSNIGLELALREKGIELVRTQVGDRFVLEELLARGASIGGEQSGHIIFPDISLAGDGLITAIELLRAMRAADKPLATLAAPLVRYPQVLLNVRVRTKPLFQDVPGIRSAVEEVERELAGRGRLLLRYSGTENLARVMIEGENQGEIEAQARRLAEVISNEIGE